MSNNRRILGYKGAGRRTPVQQAFELKSEALSFIERINEGESPLRQVTHASVVEVLRRSLNETRGFAFSVRKQTALNDLAVFAAAVQGNLALSAYNKNADLFPVSHPFSERNSSLSDSALSHAQLQWVLADRSVEGEIRPLLASALSDISTDIEKTYATSRLRSIDGGYEVLAALTAAFGGDGNSRWARRLRAMRQRRDRKGRFAYMGGGMRALVRRKDGTVEWLTGRPVGAPSDGNDFQIELADGRIAQIPAGDAEAIKAFLPAKGKTAFTGEKADYSTSDADSIIDEANIKFVDAPAGWEPAPDFPVNEGEKAFTDGDYTAIRNADGKFRLVDYKGEEIAQGDNWRDIMKAADIDALGGEEPALAPNDIIAEGLRDIVANPEVPELAKIANHAADFLQKGIEPENEDPTALAARLEKVANALEAGDFGDNKVGFADDFRDAAKGIAAKLAGDKEEKRKVAQERAAAVRKFIVPEGAYEIKPDDYNPVGKQDNNVAEDFTDDPKELAQMFEQKQLVNALEQALLGRPMEVEGSELPPEPVEPEGKVDPAKMKEYKKALKDWEAAGDENAPKPEEPMPNAPTKEQMDKYEEARSEWDALAKQKKSEVVAADGNGLLPFDGGDDIVEAEALRDALKEQGVDADNEIAKIYNKNLPEGEKNPVGGETAKEKTVPAEDVADVIESDVSAEELKQIESANKISDIGVDIVKDVENGDLPDLLDGLTREEQDALAMSEDFRPFLPKDAHQELPGNFHQLDPNPFPMDKVVRVEEGDELNAQGWPVGWTNDPYYLAKNYSADDLKNQFYNAMLNVNEGEEGKGRFLETDTDGEDFFALIEAEAIRDALKLQGVDTDKLINGFVDDYKKDVAEKSLLGDFDAFDIEMRQHTGADGRVHRLTTRKLEGNADAEDGLIEVTYEIKGADGEWVPQQTNKFNDEDSAIDFAVDMLLDIQGDEGAPARGNEPNTDEINAMLEGEGIDPNEDISGEAPAEVIPARAQAAPEGPRPPRKVSIADLEEGDVVNPNAFPELGLPEGLFVVNENPEVGDWEVDYEPADGGYAMAEVWRNANIKLRPLDQAAFDAAMDIENNKEGFFEEGILHIDAVNADEEFIYHGTLDDLKKNGLAPEEDFVAPEHEEVNPPKRLIDSRKDGAIFRAFGIEYADYISRRRSPYENLGGYKNSQWLRDVQPDPENKSIVYKGKIITAKPDAGFEVDGTEFVYLEDALENIDKKVSNEKVLIDSINSKGLEGPSVDKVVNSPVTKSMAKEINSAVDELTKKSEANPEIEALKKQVAEMQELLANLVNGALNPIEVQSQINDARAEGKISKPEKAKKTKKVKPSDGVATGAKTEADAQRIEDEIVPSAPAVDPIVKVGKVKTKDLQPGMVTKRDGFVIEHISQDVDADGKHIVLGYFPGGVTQEKRWFPNAGIEVFQNLAPEQIPANGSRPAIHQPKVEDYAGGANDLRYMLDMSTWRSKLAIARRRWKNAPKGAEEAFDPERHAHRARVQGIDLKAGDVMVGKGNFVIMDAKPNPAREGWLLVRGYYPGHIEQVKEWKQDTPFDIFRNIEVPEKGLLPDFHKPFFINKNGNWQHDKNDVEGNKKYDDFIANAEARFNAPADLPFFDGAGLPEQKPAAAKKPREPRDPADPLAQGEFEKILAEAAGDPAKLKEILNGKELIFFDFETTGLSKDKDGVWQLGAVKVVNGEIVDRFNIYMNPEVPVDPKLIAKLKQVDPDGNPISDEFLQKQLSRQEAMNQFAEFAGKNPLLVAQNVKFDRGFLEKIINDDQMDMAPAGYLDPQVLARMLFDEDPNKIPTVSLGPLAKHFGIEIQHHDALSDVEALREVLNKVLDRMAETGFGAKHITPEGAKAWFDAEVAKYEANLAKYKNDLQAFELAQAVKNAEAGKAVNLDNIIEAVNNPAPELNAQNAEDIAGANATQYVQPEFMSKPVRLAKRDWIEDPANARVFEDKQLRAKDLQAGDVMRGKNDNVDKLYQVLGVQEREDGKLEVLRANIADGQMHQMEYWPNQFAPEVLRPISENSLNAGTPEAPEGDPNLDQIINPEDVPENVPNIIEQDENPATKLKTVIEVKQNAYDDIEAVVKLVDEDGNVVASKSIKGNNLDDVKNDAFNLAEDQNNIIANAMANVGEEDEIIEEVAPHPDNNARMIAAVVTPNGKHKVILGKKLGNPNVVGGLYEVIQHKQENGLWVISGIERFDNEQDAGARLKEIVRDNGVREIVPATNKGAIRNLSKSDIEGKGIGAPGTIPPVKIIEGEGPFAPNKPKTSGTKARKERKAPLNNVENQKRWQARKWRKPPVFWKPNRGLFQDKNGVAVNVGDFVTHTNPKIAAKHGAMQVVARVSNLGRIRYDVNGNPVVDYSSYVRVRLADGTYTVYKANRLLNQNPNAVENPAVNKGVNEFDGGLPDVLIQEWSKFGKALEEFGVQPFGLGEDAFRAEAGNEQAMVIRKDGDKYSVFLHERNIHGERAVDPEKAREGWWAKPMFSTDDVEVAANFFIAEVHNRRYNADFAPNPKWEAPKPGEKMEDPWNGQNGEVGKRIDIQQENNKEINDFFVDLAEEPEYGNFRFDVRPNAEGLDIYDNEVGYAARITRNPDNGNFNVIADPLLGGDGVFRNLGNFDNHKDAAAAALEFLDNERKGQGLALAPEREESHKNGTNIFGIKQIRKIDAVDANGKEFGLSLIKNEVGMFEVAMLNPEGEEMGDRVVIVGTFADEDAAMAVQNAVQMLIGMGDGNAIFDAYKKLNINPFEEIQPVNTPQVKAAKAQELKDFFDNADLLKAIEDAGIEKWGFGDHIINVGDRANNGPFAFVALDGEEWRLLRGMKGGAFEEIARSNNLDDNFLKAVKKEINDMVNKNVVNVEGAEMTPAQADAYKKIKDAGFKAVGDYNMGNMRDVDDDQRGFFWKVDGANPARVVTITPTRNGKFLVKAFRNENDWNAVADPAMSEEFDNLFDAADKVNAHLAGIGIDINDRNPDGPAGANPEVLPNRAGNAPAAEVNAPSFEKYTPDWVKANAKDISGTSAGDLKLGDFMITKSGRRAGRITSIEDLGKSVRITVQYNDGSVYAYKPYAKSTSMDNVYRLGDGGLPEGFVAPDAPEKAPRAPRKPKVEIPEVPFPVGDEMQDRDNLVQAMNALRAKLPKVRNNRVSRDERQGAKAVEDFINALNRGDSLDKISTYNLEAAIRRLGRANADGKYSDAIKNLESLNKYIADNKERIKQERIDKFIAENDKPFPEGIVPEAENIDHINAIAPLQEVANRLPTESDIAGRDAVRAREELLKAVESLKQAGGVAEVKDTVFDNLDDAIKKLRSVGNAKFEEYADMLAKVKTDLARKVNEAPIGPFGPVNAEIIDPEVLDAERVQAGENKFSAGEFLRDKILNDNVIQAYPHLSPFIEKLREFFADENPKPLAMLNWKERHALNLFVAQLLRNPSAYDGVGVGTPESNRKDLVNLMFQLHQEKLAGEKNRTDLGVGDALRDLSFEKMKAVAKDFRQPLIIDGVDTGFDIKSNDVFSLNPSFLIFHRASGQFFMVKKEGKEDRANAEVAGGAVIQGLNMLGGIVTLRSRVDNRVVVMSKAGDGARLKEDVRNFSAGKPADKISLMAIIQMAVLDGIIDNTDRHGGNFMIAKLFNGGVVGEGNDEYGIFAIDNGFGHMFWEGHRAVNPEEHYRKGNARDGGQLTKDLIKQIGATAYKELADLSAQQLLQYLQRKNAAGLDLPQDKFDEMLARVEQFIAAQV